MAGRMGFAAGRSGAEPGDDVDLAVLMDALFEGESSPLKRNALRELPSVPEQRYWLLQELQTLLERAALKQPIFLALDDLQWADAGTSAAIRILTSRLGGLPIAWVMALRLPQGSSPISATVRRLDRDGAERISIGPLGQGAVVQISRDMTGGDPDDALVDLMGRAHGNPFLLIELLTGLLEEDRIRVVDGQASTTGDSLPARVHASMGKRLGALSDEARDSAVLSGSLGRTFSFDELAAMLARPPSSVLEPVEELIDAGILVDHDGELAFLHDITRDAVRSSVAQSVRRALDRQAVDVLLEHGALPGEVAGQLSESALPGDDSAVATLWNAARIITVSNPSGGADLCRRALELALAADPRRAELVAETALALHAAGRGEEGRTFVDTHLRNTLPADEESRVLLSVAGMFGLSPDLRLDAGRRALALDGIAATLQARHRAALFHNLLLAGRLDEGRGVLDATRQEVLASGDSIAAFSFTLAEAVLAYLSGNYAQAVELAEDACRSPGAKLDPERAGICDRMLSEALMVAERVEESFRVTDDGVTGAQRNRQGLALRLLEIWRGRRLFSSDGSTMRHRSSMATWPLRKTIGFPVCSRSSASSPSAASLSIVVTRLSCSAWQRGRGRWPATGRLGSVVTHAGCLRSRRWLPATRGPPSVGSASPATSSASRPSSPSPPTLPTRRNWCESRSAPTTRSLPSQRSAPPTDARKRTRPWPRSSEPPPTLVASSTTTPRISSRRSTTSSAARVRSHSPQRSRISAVDGPQPVGSNRALRIWNAHCKSIPRPERPGTLAASEPS